MGRQLGASARQLHIGAPAAGLARGGPWRGDIVAKRPRMNIPARAAELGPLLEIHLLAELPEDVRDQLWQLVEPAVDVLFAVDGEFETLLSKVSAVWQRLLQDPEAPTEVIKLSGASKDQALLLEHVSRGQVSPLDGLELVRVMVPDARDRSWTCRPAEIPPSRSGRI